MERCGCGVGVRRGSCGLRGMQAGRGPTGARTHSSTHRRRYTRVPRPITGHPPPRARRPRTPTTVASSDNVNREQRAKVWKCERKVRARLHRAWAWARWGCVGALCCRWRGHVYSMYAGRNMLREHAWGTAVRGRARACTLSRGVVASNASKITTTGRDGEVRGGRSGPRFGPAFRVK